MPLISTRNLTLCYDSVGTGEPLLLIMGLGAQMVAWDPLFCQLLARRGFRVIRFDNRDVGQSEKLDSLPVPRIGPLLARALIGLPVDMPYGVGDMASDVIDLMDALELDAAHLVGASMGGMIAQQVVIDHPSRVRSLTSIMSSSGARPVQWLTRPRALRALLAPAPKDRDQAMDRAERTLRALAGPPPAAADIARSRHHAALAWERGTYPRGFVRQLAATVTAPSRRRALGEVRVPSLVLHGGRDPLVVPLGGRLTAWAIPGARFRLLPGVGHYLPEALWPTLCDEIAAVARDRPPVYASRSALAPLLARAR